LQRLISHIKGVGRGRHASARGTALVRKAISENKMTIVQEAIRQGQLLRHADVHQALLKLYKDGIIRLMMRSKPPTPKNS